MAEPNEPESKRPSERFESILAALVCLGFGAYGLANGEVEFKLPRDPDGMRFAHPSGYVAGAGLLLGGFVFAWYAVSLRWRRGFSAAIAVGFGCLVAGLILGGLGAPRGYAPLPGVALATAGIAAHQYRGAGFWKAALAVLAGAGTALAGYAAAR